MKVEGGNKENGDLNVDWSKLDNKGSRFLPVCSSVAQNKQGRETEE